MAFLPIEIDLSIKNKITKAQNYQKAINKKMIGTERPIILAFKSDNYQR